MQTESPYYKDRFEEEVQGSIRTIKGLRKKEGRGRGRREVSQIKLEVNNIFLVERKKSFFLNVFD